MGFIPRFSFKILVLLTVISVSLFTAGCGGAKSPLASNKPTQPAASATPVPSPSPAAAPSPSPTPAPPSPTPTPAPAPSPSPSPTPTPAPGTQQGQVVVVVEENHSYSSVIGSSSMPYLNSLATQFGLATQYYADTHPSIGNYLMMTAGAIITNNDSFSGTLTNDNIVRHLLAAGKTWKAYEESLPSVGYTGGDTSLYARKHDPLSFFSDVVNSSVQKLNLVPFTQFANPGPSRRLAANQHRAAVEQRSIPEERFAYHRV
jgi:Phosphoesterase family